MAYALTTYEQTGVFDPTNPHQRIREDYAGSPGRWASYYFNRVPTTANLRGLGSGWASVPGWAQIGIVATVGAVAGYIGMQKFGGTIKPVLRKIPVIGGQFAGLGRRGRARRRRR